MEHRLRSISNDAWGGVKLGHFRGWRRALEEAGFKTNCGSYEVPSASQIIDTKKRKWSRANTRIFISAGRIDWCCDCRLLDLRAILRAEYWGFMENAAGQL